MTNVLGQTRLKIRNQSGLLNQIAAVYSSFLRAAMEYVDNAVDAAEGRRQDDPAFIGKVVIDVDLAAKSVTFIDNCGGMSPDQLIALLDSVGESTKKYVAWANGQFGFGVHAFRGFARYAKFASHKAESPAAQITIDRDAGDTDDVTCIEAEPDSVNIGETRVTVSGFDSHHFNKNKLVSSLAGEIQQHFDDILRSGAVEIYISLSGSEPKRLSAFDYDAIPGESVRDAVTVEDDDGAVVGKIRVDLRLLEKVAQNRLPVLTNKGRRIQTIADLKSFRKYVTQAGRSVNVWSNLFLTGSIEINDLVSPNLTRDDLKDTRERAHVYAAMLEVQLRIEELVRERQQKKRQQAYEQLSQRVSDCLAQVLKKHRIRFDDVIGSRSNGKGFTAGDEVPFGGDLPGGGGPSPNQKASGGSKGEGGSEGPGESDRGAGDKGQSKAAPDPSAPGGGPTSGPPQIEFDSYPDEPLRVIPLGSTLTVNIAHPDFVERTRGSGYMDARLASYVAQVVAGPCIEYFYAKRGKAMTPAAVISQVLELSMHLDDALIESGHLENFVNSADGQRT